MRKRIIAKYGNTDIIRLKPQDREDLGFNYGDKVDIDNLNLIGGEDQSERVCCDIDAIVNNKENKKDE